MPLTQPTPNADNVDDIEGDSASRFRAFIHDAQQRALLASLLQGFPENHARDVISTFTESERDTSQRMVNLLNRLDRIAVTVGAVNPLHATSAPTTTTTPHALADGNSDASQASGHVQDSTIPAGTLQTQSNGSDIPDNGEIAGLQSQPFHSLATAASTAKPQTDSSPATEDGDGNGVSASGNSPTNWDSDEETVVERDQDEDEDEDNDEDDDGASTSERILVALDPGLYLPQTTYDSTATSQQGNGQHLPLLNRTRPATDGANETSPECTDSSRQWNAAQIPLNYHDSSSGQAQNTNMSDQTLTQSLSDGEGDEAPGGDAMMDQSSRGSEHDLWD